MTDNAFYAPCDYLNIDWDAVIDPQLLALDQAFTKPDSQVSNQGPEHQLTGLDILSAAAEIMAAADLKVTKCTNRPKVTSPLAHTSTTPETIAREYEGLRASIEEQTKAISMEMEGEYGNMSSVVSKSVAPHTLH